MRKVFIPKRGRNKHEGEENCILRKFVTGKPNNGTKKSGDIKTGQTHRHSSKDNKCEQTVERAMRMNVRG